ncbi:hypothetical protein KL942_005125 [Ogataea angusta]|uniref:Uncharacterized protein n=1 Tax=Pichia angusta TaxID=870730 RepID=A0ABQ7RQ35_PICAN|nr:hypothetical protein KL942_005125 [Ogataea angusta]KAG7845685.1 hypothetical protein KL940_005085 [Ogataea angusta]
MVTYEELKKVLNHQTKVVSKPLVFDKDVKRFVQQVESEAVSETQIVRIINSTNRYLSKRYGQFFHRQSIVQIIQQVLNNEHALDLQRKGKLLALNEILMNFGSDTVVDVNGNYEDERGSNNIDMNGIMRIKQEEILGMIDELPDPDKLTAKNDGLLECYDELRSKLADNRARLLELQDKKKYYEKTRKLLSEMTDTTQDPDSTLQKNLVLNTNDQLVNEVSQTRIQLAMMSEKLQDPEFAAQLKKKLKLDLD